jgi:hypothetical protein
MSNNNPQSLAEKFGINLEQHWSKNLDDRQNQEISFDVTYARIYGHGTDGHNARTLIAKLADICAAMQEELDKKRQENKQEVIGFIQSEIERLNKRELWENKELKELIAQARSAVNEMNAKGRWQMSVPVRPDDSDSAILDALTALEAEADHYKGLIKYLYITDQFGLKSKRAGDEK